MTRPVDAYGTQLSRGPRHGAEDGGGRRALDAYLQFGGRAGGEFDDELAGGLARPVARGGSGGRTPPQRRRRFLDYPRAGRRGVTRWIPSWRVFVTLFLLGVAGVTGLILFLYTNTQLPSRENSDATFQTTIVYYGNTPNHELGRFTAQNRIWKPLDQIPKTVQDAVLSAEDRTFYTNQGVSFPSVVRAAVNNVRGGATQGGSTITQQYVKNAYSSTTDRSFRRKLNEFFVSLKVARDLSKDQILERYLNIIYFGRGCYGIEAASECYFGTTVDKLTPSQAAYLAGIVNGPELYDSGTAAATSAARARWTYVLDGMVSQGWLSQRARAKAAFPGKQVAKTRNEQPGTSTNRGQQPYLLDMIRSEAHQYGISDSELERNGYKIYTTFKPGFVADASRSITSVLGPRKKWPSGTQVALATVDAKTGAVVSIYGGDGKRSQNAVRQDIAEAGSTFKPFGLVAALEGKRQQGDCGPKAPDEDSLSLRSRFDGHSPQRIDGFTKGPVTNFGNEQYGMINLVTATAESVNTVFAALNDKAGPEHTMDVAICAGYPKNTQGLNANPSNVLGPSSPHPIDVARAFATFAAQGVRHDTYVITKIVAPNGAVVAQHDPDNGQQVFDKGVIADATHAMQAVVKEGTGSYVSNLGRPAAGKTGTSSDNLSAWFAGFTPQYATVVAMYRVGKGGGQETLLPWAGAGSQVTGGTLPARVWTRYMRTVLDGLPVADFPEPVYGGQTFNPAPPPTTAPVPTPTGQSPQPSPSPSPVQPTPSEPVPTVTGPPLPTPSSRPFPTLPGRPRPTIPVPTPTF